MSYITWKSKIFDEKKGGFCFIESPVLIIMLSCDVIITCNYMKYNKRKRIFKQ